MAILLWSALIVSCQNAFADVVVFIPVVEISHVASELGLW